jgi:hypothetical protein
MAPIQTMRTERRREGPSPAIHMKAAARKAAPKAARRGPASGLIAARAMAASTERCCPERARMWAQPASLKAAASSAPRSSLDPMMRASKRPAALPPTLARAPRRPSRTRERALSTGPPPSTSSKPWTSVKAALPSPAKRTSDALILAPASKARPPRARRASGAALDPVSRPKESSPAAPGPESESPSTSIE